jgi:glycerol-3-phosphate dehydrogenase (NAD(P)+)
MSRIAILGAGAWGTALGISLAQRQGHTLTLWSHSPEKAATMQSTRENAAYLPGVKLPEELRITADLADAAASGDILLFVTPSEVLRATLEQIAPHLKPGQVLVSAAKGIENDSYLRMSEVVGEVIGAATGMKLQIAVLSGPSFAREVAAGMPTAVTIAAAEPATAVQLQREFSSGSLRLYTNDDVIGVELGGALKNVIAISAGVVAGLGLGHNSAAALITRGIAEMTRLAVACGGRRETLSGLAGMGDLVLTCTGSLSRNRTVGEELGRGRKLGEILAGLHGKVAEGVHTTTAALGLARRHGVEMPITEQMAAILHEEKSPRDAIRDLMSRPGRDE